MAAALFCFFIILLTGFALGLGIGFFFGQVANEKRIVKLFHLTPKDKP